jgi:2-amino-4-hydroxy-6-hydroxymethyldihydropteridine diphosphokinase
VAEVFIGLGSNLGDRPGTLRRSLRRLQTLPMRQLGCSLFRRTTPVGLLEQPDFVNAVARFETQFNPGHLLKLMMRVEWQFGRQRRIENGPRTLDLDLLLYGNLAMRDSQLTLPHPRMTERRFVLEPMAELAPRLTLNGKAVQHYLKSASSSNSDA